MPWGVGSRWHCNSKCRYFKGTLQWICSERKFKGFGILLFTEERVLSSNVELYIVKTHRTILKGEIFFSGRGRRDDPWWELRSSMCQQLPKGVGLPSGSSLIPVPGFLCLSLPSSLCLQIGFLCFPVFTEWQWGLTFSPLKFWTGLRLES